MNIIIFSRNRACQLELLLRTFEVNFKEFYEEKIKVLYKAESPYKESYSKIRYDNVLFVKENEFKKDLLSLINKEEEFTMFLVDDIIFKNPFSLKDEIFEIFRKSNDILTLSLRLHPNLNYCYAAGIKLNPPVFMKDGSINWTKENPAGDFGYPMSLDGHVFKTIDILSILQIIPYKNPNSLEGMLAMVANNPNSTFRSKPRLLMYNKSVLFNNPINIVQTNNTNKHGDISAEHLNEEFLNGKRIKNIFKGLENLSCHQEENIEFE